jgi:hypothetical protein
MVIRITDDAEIVHLNNNPNGFSLFFHGPTEMITYDVKKKSFFGWFQKIEQQSEPRVIWSFWAALAGKDQSELASRLQGWQPPKTEDLAELDRSYELLHIALSGRNFLEEGSTIRDCFCYDDGDKYPPRDYPWWGFSCAMLKELKVELDALTKEELAKRLPQERVVNDELLIQYHNFDDYQDILDYLEVYLETTRKMVDRAISTNRGMIFVWMV